MYPNNGVYPKTNALVVARQNEQFLQNTIDESNQSNNFTILSFYDIICILAVSYNSIRAARAIDFEKR